MLGLRKRIADQLSKELSSRFGPHAQKNVFNMKIKTTAYATRSIKDETSTMGTRHYHGHLPPLHVRQHSDDLIK